MAKRHGPRNYSARITAGLCGRCGRPRGEDGTATECRQHARRRSRQQAVTNEINRLAARLAGLCPDCKERRDVEGNEVCRVCRIKRGENARRRLQVFNY